MCYHIEDPKLVYKMNIVLNFIYLFDFLKYITYRPDLGKYSFNLQFNIEWGEKIQPILLNQRDSMILTHF